MIIPKSGEFGELFGQWDSALSVIYSFKILELFSGCILTAVFDYLLIDDPSSDGNATAKMICAVVGKFGVAGTFGIVYVHASEMYPTPVRGVGVGLSSAGGRIGGILAPIINGLGKTTSWLPFVVFAALGIVQVITGF